MPVTSVPSSPRPHPRRTASAAAGVAALLVAAAGCAPRGEATASIAYRCANGQHTTTMTVRSEAEAPADGHRRITVHYRFERLYIAEWPYQEVRFDLALPTLAYDQVTSPAGPARIDPATGQPPAPDTSRYRVTVESSGSTDAFTVSALAPADVRSFDWRAPTSMGTYGTFTPVPGGPPVVNNFGCTVVDGDRVITTLRVT